MSKCQFFEPWQGRCGKECEGAYCEAHKGVKCQVCGEQADRKCSHTGQFVCGFPLCPNCEGYQKDLNCFGQPDDGIWGFMRHGHRRKESE